MEFQYNVFKIENTKKTDINILLEDEKFEYIEHYQKNGFDYIIIKTEQHIYKSEKDLEFNIDFTFKELETIRNYIVEILELENYEVSFDILKNYDKEENQKIMKLFPLYKVFEYKYGSSDIMLEKASIRMESFRKYLLKEIKESEYFENQKNILIKFLSKIFK